MIAIGWLHTVAILPGQFLFGESGDMLSAFIYVSTHLGFSLQGMQTPGRLITPLAVIDDD